MVDGFSGVGHRGGLDDEPGGEVVGFLFVDSGWKAGDKGFIDGIVVAGEGAVEIGGAVEGGGGDVGVVVGEEVGDGEAWRGWVSRHDRADSLRDIGYVGMFWERHTFSVCSVWGGDVGPVLLQCSIAG